MRPAARAAVRVAVRVAVLTAGAVAGLMAAAQVPIRPNDAILGCQARSVHEIEAMGGRDARPVERLESQPLPGHMWRVTGVFEALIEAETRRLAVACDVSSAGVQVFTMEAMR